MSDQHDQDKKLHEYDGITELDNSLPRWWLGLFGLTIVFSLVYCGYYLVGGGPTLMQEFLAERSQHAHTHPHQASNSAAGSVPDDAMLAAVAKDAARVSAGKAIYLAKCLACHGNAGQGGIGPNLVDDHWIHGGKLSQVYQIIADGVADKGMPPWKAMLKPEEMQSLVGFIRSIRGTQPPGAKAPQGEVYKE